MSTATTDLDTAIKKLRSLHDGDLGVVDTVMCGKRAIPALRALLFEREPSGLFESRCRAVRALSTLNARDVLVDFLTEPRRATDPVERLGDDAVINAAARALAKYQDEDTFQLLVNLLDTQLLPGAVAAIGSFGRIAAIPYLIAALAEDECRPYAEAALEKIGPRARGALIDAVKTVAPDNESPSHARQRQSALRLLVRISTPRTNRTDRTAAMQHTDPKGVASQ